MNQDTIAAALVVVACVFAGGCLVYAGHIVGYVLLVFAGLVWVRNDECRK